MSVRKKAKPLHLDGEFLKAAERLQDLNNPIDSIVGDMTQELEREMKALGARPAYLARMLRSGFAGSSEFRLPLANGPADFFRQINGDKGTHQVGLKSTLTSLSYSPPDHLQRRL